MSPTAQVISIGGRQARCENCGHIGSCMARDADNPEASGRHDIPVVPRIVHRGEHLFRAGESFENVYVVRSGAVKTYVISSQGDVHVTGFHLPGDLVGADAIASGQHVCSAEALDTCSICVLPFDRLTALCMRSPTVQLRLLKHLSSTIVRDEALLLRLGQRTAEQRLAAFLLEQAERRRVQGYSPYEVNLAMSRADIGSYLALAVETVSRILTRLQEHDIITVQRNRIRIRDLAALEALAEEAPPSRRAAAH
ncbi:MAG: helix-turn-helix domain-containing protein [Ectothiorhodospiraceae bacterium]|nr:helix-turn-helix domain-containing protein [Chromatiales bacterium]MCP5153771.1 helix-turn-helix domain-containing protein [Ectothiorhodospiraceae bacterium]